MSLLYEQYSFITAQFESMPKWAKVGQLFEMHYTVELKQQQQQVGLFGFPE